MPVGGAKPVTTPWHPEWLQPDQASVMEPAWHSPIRSVIALLGLDDPQQQIMGFGTALPVGAMEGGALEAVAAKFPRLMQAVKTAKATVLPMDEASRLARATKQGFKTGETLYHGSTSEFPAFESRQTFRNLERGPEAVQSQAHFLSTEPATANAFAQDKVLIDQNLRGTTSQPSVRKFVVKSKKPLDLTVSPAVRQKMLQDGYSPYFNSDGINPYGAKKLEQITGSSFETWNDVHAALDDPHVIAALEDAGYDSVRLREMNLEGDTVAVFAPHQIRSPEAAFDPKQKLSGNILAGVGLGAAVGVGAAQDTK